MADEDRTAEHMEIPFGDLQAVWEESEGPGFPPRPHEGRSTTKEILFCFYFCETSYPQDVNLEHTCNLNKRLLINLRGGGEMTPFNLKKELILHIACIFKGTNS